MNGYVILDEAKRSGSNTEALTEDAAALEFESRFAGKLLYCHDTGAWFTWTGSHWRVETTGLAFEWARQVARSLADGETPRARAVAGKAGFASSVERFARSTRAFAVNIDTWDRDPWLLGTPGGTVDLRSGVLREGRQDEGITKICAVAPAGTPECRRWLRFLDEATGNDRGLVRFLQQWCGYCLTGITREHALVFVFGPGGNGKSVFINVVTAILGAYATTSAMDTFTPPFGDRHPTDIAMLRGARLVTASETEEGRAWAEARIKQMTGGDQITARFMRENNFTFTPAFKLTIVGNHKPVLRNVDDAARRRFNIVPFTLKPAAPDLDLEMKLKQEWPGILRWMIEGCLDWQGHGLVRPDSVVTATETYFSDQDLLAQWIAEECDAEPDNPHKWEATGELFESWCAYAAKAGEKPGTKRSFTEAMQRYGFVPHRKARNTVRVLLGVRLVKLVTNDGDDGR